jgi:hypothetical protein
MSLDSAPRRKSKSIQDPGNKRQWERKNSQQLELTEVKVWLEDLGLAQYTPNFEKAGFMSFRSIQHMNPAQRQIMTTKVGMPPVDADIVFSYFLQRDQKVYASPKKPGSSEGMPNRSIEMTSAPGSGRGLTRQNSPAPQPAEPTGWIQRARRTSKNSIHMPHFMDSNNMEIARKPSSFWVGWKQHGQRFLDRDERGNQSKGNANVTISSPNKAMLTKDYVHTLLEMRTWKLLVVLCTVYCVCFCAYAPLYWWASDACDLQIDSYR